MKQVIENWHTTFEKYQHSVHKTKNMKFPCIYNASTAILKIMVHEI